MSLLPVWDESRTRGLVRKLVLRELQSGMTIPSEEEDLVKAGVIDSMGWVGILSGVEEETGIRNFGASWPADRRQSINALVEVLLGTQCASAKPDDSVRSQVNKNERFGVLIAGWGFALGSLKIDTAAVERELGLTAETLSERAGIQSVNCAGKDETEISLGLQAAGGALAIADLDSGMVDAVVATSATCLGFPSLAALLHTRLLLRESCAAIDVGGACVGVLNALATAKGLIGSGQCQAVLVVAAEVNTRRLSGPEVPGEFRGLFGDGACAFLLVRDESDGGNGPSRIGKFIFGCSGAFASSLRITLRPSGPLEVNFEGKRLGSVALSTLEQILNRLEDSSGISISEVGWFALHEPNPRLVAILAERLRIPPDRIVHTTADSGNLGSVTCGINLCRALTSISRNPVDSPNRTIFMAAVGPGLLWGGTYIY
ncbi:MAG: 3-oxoacyl-ACP synthase III family protein [Terriglobia bacterium]